MNKKYILIETGSGHTHTVTLDSEGNGISTVNSGHSHKVEGMVALPAFNTDGHLHNIQRFEGFGGLAGGIFSSLLANLISTSVSKSVVIIILFLIFILYSKASG